MVTMKRSLFLATTCAFSAPLVLFTATGVALAADTTSTTEASATQIVAGHAESAPPEPFWGRIYLRHGVAPIQYFRDTFGGPMVEREVEFYFPRDNPFGCDALEDDEQDMIFDAASANRSIALVVDRGECTFEDKSRIAESAGAAALVVVNADDSVSRPVAQTDDGEIRIPSVMVRKSAGELLRAAVAHERVYGRLLPMVCTKRPYACAPRTKPELTYMTSALVRSGVLVSSADQSVIGDFLASTFGGVMPQRTALQLSTLLHSSVVCQSADTEPMPRLDGQVALIAGSGADAGCAVLDMVTAAQAVGAIAALVVTDSSSTSVSSHASVQEDWLGYNVTIFSAVISSTTTMRLVELQEQGAALSLVHFEARNAIADAWEQIHRLSTLSAWPARQDRKEKLVKKLLKAFTLNAGQTETLKSHYVTVAGASLASWNTLVPAQAAGDAEAEASRSAELETPDDALATKLAAAAVATGDARDEL